MNPSTLVLFFFLAVALALARLRSGALTLPIVMHMEATTVALLINELTRSSSAG
ncbi:hypothetical protein [Caldimonas brevitalea]|uniref:hypothetical protein n=1 Tax=Caldimonas brevitalea TaxID=413882 RepID=UPI0012FA6528|nr:hypothetical protein [Caldimonas brevitalea]